MTVFDEPVAFRPVETPFTSLAAEALTARPVTLDPLDRRMLFALSAAIIVGFLMLMLRTGGAREATVSGSVEVTSAGEAGPSVQESEEPSAIVPAAGTLAPIFTPEVMYWQDQIVDWARQYSLDPNLAAIIMQVESCGDPQAVSVAGALGLFQVMPFHFQAGEDGLDPATNARRGLAYFADRLAQTNGDVGRAFAGYNGGHVAAAGSWDSWAAETQRYYVWTTGLLQDLQTSPEVSPTLQQWLAAGGASLCRQAAARLGLPSQ